MSGFPARGSPAPSSLMGVLRSWLQAGSGEVRPSSKDLPGKATGPKAHCYGQVRVLVVDDNPVNLMVISALLASRGLVPWLAADGAEAVALACRLPLDLILMDLQMPILDGLGATRALRRFETHSSRAAVPVVAYSSLSPGASVLAMHGLNGSLNKPCEDQELEDCLVRWCPSYRPAPVACQVADHHRHRQQEVASASQWPGSADVRALPDCLDPADLPLAQHSPTLRIPSRHEQHL